LITETRYTTFFFAYTYCNTLALINTNGVLKGSLTTGKSTDFVCSEYLQGTAGSRDRVVHIMNTKHNRWHLVMMARMRHMINLEAGATEGCHSWFTQSFKNLSLWAWITIITASTAFLERSYVDSGGYKRTDD